MAFCHSERRSTGGPAARIPLRSYEAPAPEEVSARIPSGGSPEKGGTMPERLQLKKRGAHASSAGPASTCFALVGISRGVRSFSSMGVNVAAASAVVKWRRADTRHEHLSPAPRAIASIGALGHGRAETSRSVSASQGKSYGGDRASPVAQTRALRADRHEQRAGLARSRGGALRSWPRTERSHPALTHHMLVLFLAAKGTGLGI